MCAGSLAAAKPILLPKPKPRTMRQQVVMPSIRSRDVARAQRPRIRRRIDALQPLDLGNSPFSIHPSTISTRTAARSIRHAISKDPDSRIHLPPAEPTPPTPAMRAYQCRADTPVHRLRLCVRPDLRPAAIRDKKQPSSWSEAKGLCTLSAAPAISALRLVVIRGIEVDSTSNGHHARRAGHAFRPEI